jgi:ABC-type phosphate transport system substrate-binding protein
MKFVSSPSLVIALSAGILAAPLAASAQTPSYSTGGETIHGTISSIRDSNHLLVADDRGFTDDVTLRANASNARLEPGERVTISGSNGGRTFVADRVDVATAATPPADPPAAAAAPVYVPVPAYVAAPVYYPAPIYYPAPAYYGYRYPVSVGLFFHFR